MPNYPTAYRSTAARDQGGSGFQRSSARRTLSSQSASNARTGLSLPPFQTNSQRAMQDALAPQRAQMNSIIAAASRLRNPAAWLQVLMDLLALWLRQRGDKSAPVETGFAFTAGAMVCGIPNSGIGVGAQNACGLNSVKSKVDWANELARPRPWYRTASSMWAMSWGSNIRQHPVNPNTHLLIDFNGWWQQNQFPQGVPGGNQNRVIPEYAPGNENPGQLEQSPEPLSTLAPEIMSPGDFRADPQPLPWRMLPQRLPAWNREVGPSTRPRVEPGTWPRPRPEPEVTPQPRPRPRPQPEPEVIWTPDAKKNHKIGLRMRVAPNSHQNKKPPRGTKELKIKTRHAHRIVAGAMNYLTETDDVVNCMYGALPKDIRRDEWRKEAAVDKNNGITSKTAAHFMTRKLGILAKHLHNVDQAQLHQCLLKEALNDMLIGKSRQALGKKKGDYVGNEMGAGLSNLSRQERIDAIKKIKADARKEAKRIRSIQNSYDRLHRPRGMSGRNRMSAGGV